MELTLSRAREAGVRGTAFVRRTSFVRGARLPLVLGALAVAAMVAAVLATRHTAVADSSPVDPAGRWRTVWICSAIVGYGVYALAVLVARRRSVRLALALGVAVIVQAAPLAAPLLLSRDVYLYWSEARTLIVHHANPYRVAPSAFPDDPATQATSAQWRTQTEPYGPAWVVLGSAPAAAAGDSRVGAEVGYRIVAAAGIAALLALLAFVARSPRGLVVLGWNPLIALHYAGGGHSDAWMMVALVAALLVGRRALGGTLWGVSAAFKGVAAVILPLELARTRLREPRGFWIGLVGGGLAIALASTVAFGTGWATVAALGAHGTSPLGVVHFLGEAGLRHRYAVALAGLAFAVIYVVLLREAWRRGRSRLAFAMSALVMLSSLFRPWYVLWPVGLAAVEGEVLGVAAAVALTGYALFADAIP